MSFAPPVRAKGRPMLGKTAFFAGIRRPSGVRSSPVGYVAFRDDGIASLGDILKHDGAGRIGFMLLVGDGEDVGKVRLHRTSMGEKHNVALRAYSGRAMAIQSSLIPIPPDESTRLAEPISIAQPEPGVLEIELPWADKLRALDGSQSLEAEL